MPRGKGRMLPIKRAQGQMLKVDSADLKNERKTAAVSKKVPVAEQIPGSVSNSGNIDITFIASADTETVEDARTCVIKRSRGRPKGSKNKKTIETEQKTPEEKNSQTIRVLKTPQNKSHRKEQRGIKNYFSPAEKLINSPKATKQGVSSPRASTPEKLKVSRTRASSPKKAELTNVVQDVIANSKGSPKYTDSLDEYGPGTPKQTRTLAIGITVLPAVPGCSAMNCDDQLVSSANSGSPSKTGSKSTGGTMSPRKVQDQRQTSPGKVDSGGCVIRGSPIRKLRGKAVWRETESQPARKPACRKSNQSQLSSTTKACKDQFVPCSPGQKGELSSIPHVEEACITDSMEKEEHKIHKKMQQQEEQESKESMQEWHNMMEHQRFSRLQHLLDKSNIYCQFLLKRMEDQRIQEEKRLKREEKKQEKLTTKAEQQVPEVERRSSRVSQKEQTSPGDAQKKPSKRGRKRKADDELKSTSYKISDYISQDVIVKKQKLSEKENKTPSTSPKATEQHVPSKGKSPKVIGSPSHEVRYINGEEVSPSQPKLVTGGVLRSYQLEGVEWLKGLYENGVNGILADEMGLGKTIQCIGLVAYLIEMGVKGPFLVAAPLSTLPNWVSEFRRFAPQIPVVLYHGSKAERESLRRKISKVKRAGCYETMPVVVTSYEISMNDGKTLQHLMWKHMIVDEGHRIKNLNCRLIKELKSYNSANRLLLTGTPLQNNLAELWSLLNFLLPDIFDDLNSFQRWFDFSAINDEGGNEKIIAQEREHQVLDRLHALLTPFLLRRLKSDVELSLPPKKEVLVYAPLTSKQKEFYKAALDKTILNIVGNKDEEKVDEHSSTGRLKRKGRQDIDYKIFDDDHASFEELADRIGQLEKARKDSLSVSSKPQSHEISVRITNILMLLRKCCNHPYLLEYPLDPATQQFKIDEELVKCSGKMLLLDQLVPALRRRGHKILIFSQMTKMLDILQDYCYLRGFDCSRLDGSMKMEDRREQMDAFASDPDRFIFLLSTRAGGLGLNLSAADTVIIYDSDWNPQSDLQAQDRCHRIGQTKPILVYRIVTANTVDQKIVERAASKRKLEKMVIYKGKFKGKMDSSTINAGELKELLESSHHDEIISRDHLVLSKSELENLLDRSSMYVKHQEKAVDVPDVDNTDTTLFRVIKESS